MKYKQTGELGDVARKIGICYYHQVYTLLVRALTDGTIPSGTALPSESELMERFQVSRNTVRRALARLEAEKRIIRRRGSGSYARSIGQAEISADDLADAAASHDAQRPQTVGRLLRVQPVTTPDFIRRREPRFPATSLMVQRSLSFKSVPFSLSTSHVPEHLAARLTRSVLTRHAVLLALDSQGVKPFSAEQMITAVAADSIAARHLEIEPASPLMSVHRLVRDGEGHAIEYQVMQFPPDRFTIRENMLLVRTDAGLQWSKSEPVHLPAWLG
jgi:GntR family transcriptional regulator